MIPTLPKFVQRMYPRRVWEGLPLNNAIYLSFDDGPIPEVTPWVLEQLQAHKAKATFFCIGHNVEKHPEIFKRIAAEGHAVGNHTFNHLNGWKTGNKRYFQNVEKAKQTMEATLSKKFSENAIFRPPYGKLSNAQAKHLMENGYQIVMWSILSMDYDPRISAAQCKLNITQNLKPGSIVVFHDSLKAEKKLKQVLPQILKYGLQKGYNFQKLGSNIPF